MFLFDLMDIKKNFLIAKPTTLEATFFVVKKKSVVFPFSRLSNQIAFTLATKQALKALNAPTGLAGGGSVPNFLIPASNPFHDR